MIFTRNNLIGNESFGCELEFLGSDNKEVFLENCKTQPDDWYYRNLSFTYKYNKDGHRCEELENVDLDNYILFTGCSHTEGIGLELEKSYPYLISKQLGMSYYNLAVSGTGLDVQEYNLISWISLVKKKPKILIIQWSDHTRFISLNQGYSNLVPRGTWTGEEETRKFVVYADLIGYYNSRKILSTNLIKNIYQGISIHSVNISNLSKHDKYGLSWRKMDTARDLCHFGVKSNQHLTDAFFNEYADKYINARLTDDIRGQK